MTASTINTFTFIVKTAIDVAGNAPSGNDTFSFTTAAGAPQFDISGMTNPTNEWWEFTTAGGVNIYFHFLFGQSGQSLSLGSECSGVAFNDRCISLSQNLAGQDAAGPNSHPEYLWSFLKSLTGTYIGSQITFTITNVNDRSFTFTGTVTSAYSMTGTIGGPTLPSEAATFTRPMP